MITTATVTTIVLTDHSRTVCHSWIEQRDRTLSARLQFLISTHLKLQPRRAIAVWYFEFLRISMILSYSKVQQNNWFCDGTLCRKICHPLNGPFATDDINDMPFTTLLSEQIAEW